MLEHTEDGGIVALSSITGAPERGKRRQRAKGKIRRDREGVEEAGGGREQEGWGRRGGERKERGGEGLGEVERREERRRESVWNG